MQKSIFRKYLTITMSIVLLSFITLGSVMTVFFSRYWRSEKKAQLTQNATAIAGISGRLLSLEDGSGEALQLEMLRSFTRSFSAASDGDVFITDPAGNVLLGNFRGKDFEESLCLPQPMISAACAGMYEGMGDFGGVYRENYDIVGVPIRAGEDGPCLGAVFTASSAAGIRAFRIEVIKNFLIASAAALALSFLLVGYFAYRQVRPMRQMSAAARRFGTGDFSVRVPVSTNDELGELARSFNNMANSLSNSEGARRSFIANVSHELKTPMTTIAGFIDGILDGTIPKEEQEKYLQIVSSEIKRLSRLVKSMLDLSRIDNGELQLSPVNFDLTGTVVSTLLTFEKSIEDKHIDVRGLEDVQPQTVRGDQDLLHQVVYNLLENAVKFTDPGGYIRIQITDGIDRTSVVIENSGQGISPEELPRIFERFYKTDQSRSRDKNGMGLGLYIVKTILKLHGGDISVRSEVGKYCRFEFYIPKPAEGPKLKEPSQPKVKEPKSKNKTDPDAKEDKR